MTVREASPLSASTGTTSDGRPTRPEPSTRLTRPEQKRRMVSMDWARGLLNLFSVASTSVFVRADWQGHAAWDGLLPEDYIFPGLIFLSGCGFAFMVRAGFTWTRMARRVVVLLGLGVVYTMVFSQSTSLAELRFTGVLQVFAAMIIGLSLLAKVCRTPLTWLGSAFVVLGSQTAFLIWWRATRCDGTLSPECNPSLTLDPWIFGVEHVYRAGQATDPEGIMMMWGAIGCAALGAAVGSLTITLFRTMGHEQVTTRQVLATFLVPAAAFGCGWLITATSVVGIDLPAVKRIWTVSMSLQVAAGMTLVLLVGFLLFDTPRRLSPGRTGRSCCGWRW